MAGLLRAMFAMTLLVVVLSAPLFVLLPPDPTVRAPFVPVIVVVAGTVSYVYVYRDGVEDRREVTGVGPESDDKG